MNPYFDDAANESVAQGGAAAQTRHEPAQQEAQSPLLLSDMQSAEELFAPPRASQRPRQAVVAVLLVVGAVGAIFAMRHFGMGPTGALADVDLDYKPSATTLGGISPGKVLADLERSRRAVQVPAENITQDPFELDNTTAEVESPTVDPDLAQRAESERLLQAQEARRRAVEDDLRKLTLQGVMAGSVPVARVSGKLYKVGMPIGEYFTVTDIAGRTVTLQADGQSFTLTMDEQEEPRKPPKKSR